LDLDRHKVIGRFPTGIGPGEANVSPDGKTVVVANRGDDTLTIADAETMHVRATVPVCHEPDNIVILPDSAKAFASCSGPASTKNRAASRAGIKKPVAKSEHGQLVAIDLKTDSVLTYLEVGATPSDLALKPDGGELFVTNFDSDSVSQVETGANEVGATRLMGGQPARGLVSSDNTLLYVSNFGSGSVSVYSIDNSKLLGTVQVGSKPDALALQPPKDGKEYFLLVADSGSDDVAVVFLHQKVAAWTLFTMVPVGHEPRQIAVKPFLLRKPPQ
jgi:YVTN family beta-propeller protein